VTSQERAMRSALDNRSAVVIGSYWAYVLFGSPPGTRPHCQPGGNMKTATAFILSLALAVFTFAQQPAPAANQTTSPAPEQKVGDVSSIPKATLYVYWVRSGISGNKPSVYIDEKEMLRMRSGHFLGVNLDPGPHVVRSTEKAAAVTLDVKPGETYYIGLGFAEAGLKVRVETTLMSPEQGWSELGKTKPSDPEDIKNHDFAIVDSMPPKPAPAPQHPAECRSVAVTPSRSFSAMSEYKVVDVVNYAGAYVGKKYEDYGLRILGTTEGVQILLLTKGYTPHDVEVAHNFCETKAKKAASAALGEQVSVVFDARTWRLGSMDLPGVQQPKEYVLPGETVDNWTELVTVQSMPGYQERTTAEGTALEFKEKILKGCPKATFTVLQEGKTDFTVEWQTTGCKGWDNQYEISRFITGKTAMYRVVYTNRKLPIPEDKRRQWIDLIGKASVAMPAPVLPTAPPSGTSPPQPPPGGAQ
jgi:hypothetical protein